MEINNKKISLIIFIMGFILVAVGIVNLVNIVEDFSYLATFHPEEIITQIADLIIGVLMLILGWLFYSKED